MILVDQATAGHIPHKKLDTIEQREGWKFTNDLEEERDAILQ